MNGTDDGPHYRITIPTAGLMVAVALIFDLVQAAAKLLAFLGVAGLGGLLGAVACEAVKVNATGMCIATGAAAGTAAAYVPIAGQALAALAATTGMILSGVASFTAVMIGYPIMIFWFAARGVSPFSGRNMQKKILAGFIAFAVDLTPIISALPGITLWTLRMIWIARAEDRKTEDNRKDTEASAEYNELNLTRLDRRYVGDGHAHDTEEQYPHAA